MDKWKKSNPIWIFGSGNGNTYADNSRALFEHINKNDQLIRAIWITKSKNIKEAIGNKGYEAYTFYSLKGVYFALISSKIVLTNSFLDVSIFTYIFSRRKSIVQLWHGTPLKVLENMSWTIGKKIVLNLFLIYIGRDCDIIISATKENIAPYISNFKVTKKQIKITGQPRNDYLFETIPKNTLDNKCISVWYLPTFREFNPEYDVFEDAKFNAELVQDFLQVNNMTLFIKLHPVDAKKFEQYSSKLSKCPNIKLVNPDNLYAELSHADILLTDYSSIYFDFLLLDRPIIFTPFDLNDYEKNRNFYYDYTEVTPGPKAMNWNEVLNSLACISADMNKWAAQRNAVNYRFNYFNDNRSCERALAAILGHKHT